MKRILADVAIMAFIFFIQNNFVDLNDSFNIVENRMEDNINFIENGVRSESTTINSVEKTIESISKRIKEVCKLEGIIYRNRIIAKDEYTSIEVNVYEFCGTTYADINLINYDKNIKISSLMKKIRKLQSYNTLKTKYYKYIKGKIDNEKEIIKIINTGEILRKVKKLNIHNGYVGTAYLFNGERVNFVNSSYDTGSYFLIGSPIIFTTY